MADELHYLATNRRGYTERAKQLGLTYEPNGILWDTRLRTTHLPIDSYIRDWMHIFVPGGVANGEIYGVVRALKQHGMPLKLLSDYAMECTLPSKYGTVFPTWLAPARFDDKQKEIHSFASYLLTLIPIIACFLQDMVLPHGIMQEHIECFLKLQTIVLLLCCGGWALQHMDLFAQTILEHHKLYVRLYPDLINQVLHLPALYIRLQKILACFVTTLSLMS